MNDALAFELAPFVDLMVQVDDPFGDRARVLADAGLDAQGYETLVASWRDRFDGDASGQLPQRFAGDLPPEPEPNK